jgi:hypothetical protein
MNKYQEALNWLSKNMGWIDDSEFPEKYQDIFNELLDKATPKKPFINGPSCRVCSNCDTYVAKIYTQNGVYKTGTTELYEFEIKFCPDCGQALDWSEDE